MVFQVGLYVPVSAQEITPYYVYGGRQDGDAYKGPSTARLQEFGWDPPHTVWEATDGGRSWEVTSPDLPAFNKRIADKSIPGIVVPEVP